MLFVLCWLTTAYVGVIALAMAVMLLLRSERKPRELVIGAGVFMLAYVAYYMHGTAPSREDLEPLNPMSVHLSGLLAATVATVVMAVRPSAVANGLSLELVTEGGWSSSRSPRERNGLSIFGVGSEWRSVRGAPYWR